MVQLLTDVEEPPVESLESASSFLVDEASAIHFQEMSRSSEGLVDSGYVSGVGTIGNGQDRDGMGFGVLASEMELTL